MEFFSNMYEYDYKIIIKFKYNHIKRKKIKWFCKEID